MEEVLNFITENWAAVSGVVLWLAARLIKTEKNYDLIEGIIKFIGNNVIPNRRKEKDPVDRGDYMPGKNNAPKRNGLNFVILCMTFGALLNVLPLQSSLAQLNGNFKTIRLVNVITAADTANVLPINATIYYNEVTNKLMAYENGQWKELISSGGLTTASNGLNVVGNDVRLGGTLSQTTSLSVNSATDQLLLRTVFGGNTGAYQIRSGNLEAYIGAGTPSSYATAANGMQINSGGVNLKGSAAVTINNITYPSADGSAGQALTTNGSGVLSFTSVGGSSAGANNEVQTSDGAGGFVASNLFFDETTGAMTLGDGSLAGNTRNIIAAGSTSATNIEINPVGSTAQLYVQNSTDPLTTFTIGRTLASGENSSMSVNGNSTTNTTTIGIANLGNDASLTMLGDQHTYTRYSKSGLAQRYVTGLDGVDNTFKLGFQNASSPTPATVTSLITLDGANIWVIMPNLPTVSPCGSAPSGTLWNNSGVMNICP